MRITFDTESEKVLVEGGELDKDLDVICRMLKAWENGQKDESIYFFV